MDNVSTPIQGVTTRARSAVDAARQASANRRKAQTEEARAIAHAKAVTPQSARVGDTVATVGEVRDVGRTSTPLGIHTAGAVISSALVATPSKMANVSETFRQRDVEELKSDSALTGFSGSQVIGRSANQTKAASIKVSHNVAVHSDPAYNEMMSDSPSKSNIAAEASEKPGSYWKDRIPPINIKSEKIDIDSELDSHSQISVSESNNNTFFSHLGGQIMEQQSVVSLLSQKQSVANLKLQQVVFYNKIGTTKTTDEDSIIYAAGSSNQFHSIQTFLDTNIVVLSRSVHFDETKFPLAPGEQALPQHQIIDKLALESDSEKASRNFQSASSSESDTLQSTSKDAASEDESSDASSLASAPSSSSSDSSFQRAKESDQLWQSLRRIFHLAGSDADSEERPVPLHREREPETTHRRSTRVKDPNFRLDLHANALLPQLQHRVKPTGEKDVINLVRGDTMYNNPNYTFLGMKTNFKFNERPSKVKSQVKSTKVPKLDPKDPYKQFDFKEAEPTKFEDARKHSTNGIMWEHAAQELQTSTALSSAEAEYVAI